ncbi:MAG TPA: MmgE/PrpD family protein, partial [Thermodesulfobacteriota bacterium]|nr:MmgE/PrpD family protein [Thermodesulfobacteriota bacterium]
MGLTQEVASFVHRTRLADIPAEVLQLAKGYVLDGVGVALAGSTEKCCRIGQAHYAAFRAKGEASVLGTPLRLPAEKAAFLNGMAAHAMDYDDTQLSTSKDAVYGLLTHPTTPVLNAAWAAAELVGASGRDLLLAYIVAVEAECRLSDAMNPRHYQSGFHSTGTVGTLGAALAAGKLLRLDEAGLVRALGLAASMAAGLRENFGTMTKPFHAGRAAENGVLAALFARRGFTTATNILEAKRGFYNAMGGGYEPAKIHGRLGNPYFFLEPGISIKPYPSGSLSHPAQDAILDLVRTHDLKPEQIERIEVGTNSNIPNALIYPMPTTELEAKFSIPFCMAIAVLERKAGIAQFKTEKVRDPRTVELMKRVTLYVDPEMEALGYDKARAVVKVTLTDGRVLTARADIARGTPPKLLTFDELAEKFRECARLAVSKGQAEEAIETIRELERLPKVATLLARLAGRRAAAARRAAPRKRAVA